MPKAQLYKTYIARMEEAHGSGSFLQASWYAYAILEDRLLSMLENSGGIPLDRRGNPIRMLGAKRAALQQRTATDKLLAAYFDNAPIQHWARKRNDLMHSMVDGTSTINEIDQLAEELADEGVELVRNLCAAAMRLKKNRSKVGSS